ncbi:MAG: dihydrolipoamide acetyltransferase family protein [Dehalococcoidia bacterium]
MSDFVMPSLGADMDFGTLLEWRVQPGDHVERGQVIAVVETEKAAVEVEVFETGTIEDLVVTPGTKVPVGTVLAHIASESVPPASAPETPAPQPSAPEPATPLHSTAALPAPAAETPPPVEQPLTPAPPATPEPAAASTSAPAPSVSAGTGRRVRVSPLARRRAEQLGMSLEGLTGTGIGGAITRDDVEVAAGAAAVHASDAGPSSMVATAAPAAEGGTALERMRAAIGAAMARSKREIPHYYLEETIDLGATMAWLDERNEHRPAHDRMLAVALFARAVALAAVEVPQLNGFWRDDHLERSEVVHLGLAVSLRDEGLVAPAILDAASKGLEQTMAELRDLASRARRGALRGAEMGSATITVTSLGDQGVERVYGVIIPPQVAIVGFGKVSERPWARDGMVGAHPVVSATLSADHRASDGYQGARFLRTIAELLQQPEQL